MPIDVRLRRSRKKRNRDQPKLSSLFLLFRVLILYVLVDKLNTEVHTVGKHGLRAIINIAHFRQRVSHR